ncbi:hypothetical protein HYH03_011080 [Edaphochlamys debaryana]|uniref:N-acetyltransferase domain-containing protein n=1 Tax=Edaphochlamys debaryana TaxID=47281 RepID=A0A835Y3M0_9CHLO|nr:hypothetical protein HYH03_011080 [Edaphochlamys debaryana]|eukprot:KAG2490444.1 hypothetical protein HYH03_011080 [Edaphochlamys debaryana]
MLASSGGNARRWAEARARWKPPRSILGLPAASRGDRSERAADTMSGRLDTISRVALKAESFSVTSKFIRVDQNQPLLKAASDIIDKEFHKPLVLGTHEHHTDPYPLMAVRTVGDAAVSAAQVAVCIRGENSPYLHIQRMATAEGFRRMGHGKVLVVMIKEAMLEAGIKVIILQALNEAVPFWSKQGFVDKTKMHDQAKLVVNDVVQRRARGVDEETTAMAIYLKNKRTPSGVAAASVPANTPGAAAASAAAGSAGGATDIRPVKRARQGQFEGGIMPPAEAVALLRQVGGSYEAALRKITEEQEARRSTESVLAGVHADLKKAEAAVQKARKARKTADAEREQLRLRLEKAEGLVEKAEAAKASITQMMQSW